MSTEQTLPSNIEITFTEDWTMVCNGEPYPGCSLVLKYHAQRLIQDISTAILGNFYVELTFRKKGRPIAKLLSPEDDSNVLSTTIDVPVYCREITMWFKVCRENGECEYDSKSGMNYKFPVRGNAIMAFRIDNVVQTRGYLTPGGTLRVCYDSRRLPARDFYLGQPCWDIQAAARFKEFGHDIRKVMEPTNDDVDPIMITDFEIPPDADFVSIWFKHWGHFSGDTYDTNCGRNYVQSFQYDGELLFTKDMETIIKGFLFAGGKVCMWYETNRIFNEPPTKKVASTKWLKMNAMFEVGGTVTEKDLGRVERDENVKAVFEIPVNASEIMLWFTYGDVESEKISFDSNLGQNYHFEVLY